MADAHGHGTAHGHSPTPDPDEPKTPMWLPAVGAVVFLAAGLLWALCPSGSADAGGADGGAPAASAAAH